MSPDNKAKSQEQIGIVRMRQSVVSYFEFEFL